ncbi:MAG: hypothetical protein ACLR78_14610 [Roseburia sp.]
MADTDCPGAESDGRGRREAQGILRTTDSDYVSNALSAEPEAGLSQSMIVVTRK